MEVLVPHTSDSQLPRVSALDLADKGTFTAIGHALANFKEKEVHLYDAVKDKPKLLRSYRSVVKEVDQLLSRKEKLPNGKLPRQQFGFGMVTFTSFWTSFCLHAILVIGFVGVSFWSGRFTLTDGLGWYLASYALVFVICFGFFMRVVRYTASLNDVVVLHRGDDTYTYIRTNQKEVEGLELKISAFLESLRLDSAEYQTGCFKCLQDFRRCQASNHGLLCAVLLICCCADQVLTLRKVLS